jgi:hypothetical protein
MAMPHQVGVTIRAPVAAERLPALRRWLAEAGRDGQAGRLFGFAGLTGLHFARLYLLEETADMAGRPIPASLVYMSEVDAPQRHHLAALAGLGAAGVDQAFQHCVGYPGPAPRRRARLAWLRRHRVRASAFYVNTVGRGLAQIRQEALLRDALEDHLDRRDHTGRTATEVRAELRAHAARHPDLAWAARPPAPPSVFFRAREAIHLVAVPAVLLLALPVLLAVVPVWLVLLRIDERRDRPFTQRPALAHLEELAACEDFTTQNPFAVVGFVRPSLLRRLTFRAVLFAADYAVRHVYNHASLAGITTIHFARWVPLDGWRRMTFASNYDGAVEAYNDDFINIVWWGLNAAFGNGVGYPPTRWLLWGGARYEQQFKHTLRCHQVAVPVWYTAYPSLTADNIENNAQIRAGLRGDMTPAQAQDWLARL